MSAMPWRSPTNPVIGKFILDEMREKGWCPFDVKTIDHTASFAGTLWYLGNLQPPRLDFDHSKCDGTLCIAMTTSSAYKTRHANPECRDCLEFQDTATIIDILEGKDIPLIQEIIPETPSEEMPKFRVVERFSHDFVAISHGKCMH